MLRYTSLMLILLVVVVIGACAPKDESAAPEAAAGAESQIPKEPPAPIAVATLQPRADSQVSGRVTFTETAEGVLVEADVARVSPGLHGLHLHALGDCSAEDFTSTGGHFNPTDAPHGAPTDEARHAGDFGNIEIGEDGAGQLRLETNMLTVADGPNTVVGRAVILHEGEDDLVTQPTGAAGSRLACGVVLMEGEMAAEAEEPTASSEG